LIAEIDAQLAGFREAEAALATAASDVRYNKERRTMNLYDTRLDFARRLIRHWLDIRGGALVPLEAEIDPNELAPIFDSLGMIDLGLPSHMAIEFAGERLRKRFGRDLEQVNWLDLVPSAVREAGKIARERARRMPCAYYHSFTVTRADAPAVTVETLALPLRRRFAAVPGAVIVVTQDDSVDMGWLTASARVNHFSCKFIDLEYPFVRVGWRSCAVNPLLQKSRPSESRKVDPDRNLQIVGTAKTA
jgi:hypothetical protein